MNKQLKYFQEDVIARLDMIALILVCGLDFSAWVCWLVGISTVMQFLYVIRAAHVWRKEKDGKAGGK